MRSDASLVGQAEWGSCRPGAAGKAVMALSRYSIAGRGTLRRIIAGLFGRLHHGPVDCHLWGAPVRLYPATNPMDRKAALRPDRLDPRELQFLRSYIKKPGAVFVDIGANSGLYSLCAALHAGPGARIIAIEPASDVLARLTFNAASALKAGRIDPSVDLVTLNVAAGDRDGEARLSITDHDVLRSLVHGTGEIVPVRRLDGLLSEHRVDRIDIMKIDVEGYEDRVLPPYLASVEPARWPRSIIIEHANQESWEIDCLADCERRGYRRISKTRWNAIIEKDAHGWIGSQAQPGSS
jgi:FkbM family methyltransferase